MGYLRTQLKTRRGRRIALITGVLLALWIFTRCGHDHIEPPTLVYLPEGSTAETIQALEDQGISVSEEALRASLHGQQVAPGWIRFDPDTSITPEVFCTRLAQPGREPTRRVVMYSGETIHRFTEQLSAQTHLSQGRLLNAYYHCSPYSDGGIMAGYYAIPYQTTADATLYTLVHQSERIFRRYTHYNGMIYDPATFKHYLILASIIQKETWHTEEMPQIASVITNRLNRDMKLQLDATLNYGPYAHTPVTPERIRTDASRYNTYRYSGLPPEPISSVTRAALDAAFHPAHTAYLFFVRTPKGMHDFSVTFAEHREKIKHYKTQTETTKSKNPAQSPDS